MLRSTFGSNRVNELRFGFSNAPVWFADSVESGPVRRSGGLQHQLPNVGSALYERDDQRRARPAATARAGTSTTPSTGFAGTHSVQFGASFSRISGWTKTADARPHADAWRRHRQRSGQRGCSRRRIFPGAAGTDLTNARAFYALLTGRVTQIAQQCPARRRHRPVRLPRRRPHRRTAGRSRPLRPGLVAHAAEHHRQCRPALAGRHPVPGQRRASTR